MLDDYADINRAELRSVRRRLARRWHLEVIRTMECLALIGELELGGAWPKARATDNADISYGAAVADEPIRRPRH